MTPILVKYVSELKELISLRDKVHSGSSVMECYNLATKLDVAPSMGMLINHIDGVTNLKESWLTVVNEKIGVRKAFIKREIDFYETYLKDITKEHLDEAKSIIE